MAATEDRPTCDMSGCDDPGYARYRHRREDRWIDVCGPHAPSFTELSFHTINHLRYPAETTSEVQKPRAFIRSGDDSDA